MYKYNFVDSPPEHGYYWVMIGHEQTLGIGESSMLLEPHNWEELTRQHPGVTFVGPIPFPRSPDMVKVGKGSTKARREMPVKNI